ncbi:MAG: flippase, partial [Solirubrobacterales bacterium]|nr:flippase [Solirubrobacterales bacterium]
MPTLARHATRQRAANDILMQVAVRIVNLAMGVVVTALVVRALGRVGYGQWSTIFIVLGLIAYFANFGMEEVALREAAREPADELEWIGAVMLLRLLALTPVMIASLIAVVLLHASHQMLISGLILVIAMPFGGISALGLVFQLRVDNRVPMLVLTLRSVLWGVAVVIIYTQHAGMIALAVAMVSTNVIGSIVQALAAVRMFGRWPRPSRTRLAPLVKLGVPLGIAGALVISYARIDQVIVFAVAGSRQAGLYGAVYNILEQSHFVPISILTTLSPVLSAAWPADRARLLRTARLTAELLAIASFGALAFAIAASGPVVRLIFGAQFSAAAPALPVLGGAFLLICFGYLNGNLMVVLGLQHRLLRISLLALAVNLLGNAILVPLVGFMGAASMTVVTEVVVLLATTKEILAKLEMPLPKPGRIGRTAVAAAVLGALLGLMRLADAPLAALIAAACVLYPALLFALRAFGPEDARVVLRRGQ